MRFKLKNGQPFEAEGIKGLRYNTKEEYSVGSAQYIEVNGRREKVRSLNSDRIYYVIEGEGNFMVDGQIYPVKTSDVVIVPKMSPYNYWGTMNLFSIYTHTGEPIEEEKLESVQDGIRKVRVRVIKPE